MTNSYNNLTAKNDRNFFLFYLIIAAIPIAGLTYSYLKNPEKESLDFKKDPIWLSIILLFILFLFAYFLYKYFFDKKVKLIIDKDGIWTPKSGLVKWQSVWYMYQKRNKGKGYSRKFGNKTN